MRSDSPAPAGAPKHAATAAGSSRSSREWARCAAALLGAAGLAITQPVLDLFGRNPEFFVVGRYERREIVLFALVVALVPASVAIVAATATWLARPRWGAVVYALALGGFGVLFALVLLDNAGVDAAWLAVGAAAAIAAVIVGLDQRFRAARSVLACLAVGNLAFVALFLFASPTSELVLGSAAGDVGTVEQATLRGPVILLVLDEFPITTIMRPDGSIDESRYPNLARLAAGSTWFRNASSLHPMTSVSVPSILTGTVPERGALPTAHDHPRSYLTLFGDRYPINSYESVTDMLPPDAEPSSLVPEPPRGTLRGAVRDGSIVYGHQILPGSLADGLPSIDHSWGGFGDELGPSEEVTRTVPEQSEAVGDDGYGRWHSLDPFDRSPIGQSSAVDRAIEVVDDSPSVNLVHVALPHYPWTLTPWGTRLTKFPYDLPKEPGDPGYETGAVLRYQLHALQVGAADAAIGRMIDQLQDVGAWDDALVVVTSDHGTGLTPPDFGRRVTEANREEVLRIPLFVKAPGQVVGEVRDEPALTVDVLPTIVDLLDVETDWAFDGHSLFDGSEATTAPKVDEDVDAALAVAARHSVDVPGEGWTGLVASGPSADVVGRQVADLPVAGPSQMSWTAHDRGIFGSLPTEDGRVPFLLSGTVAVPGDTPPELVVAVNGVVAGSLGVYGEGAGTHPFWGLMGPWFLEGANTVEAYEVERTGFGPVLHPVGVA